MLGVGIGDLGVHEQERMCSKGLCQHPIKWPHRGPKASQLGCAKAPGLIAIPLMQVPTGCAGTSPGYDERPDDTAVPECAHEQMWPTHGPLLEE